MNKYFGTVYGNRHDRAKNITLGNIRHAILTGKVMCLGTSKVNYWYDIIRKEFPDVRLRKADDAIYINEKKPPKEDKVWIDDIPSHPEGSIKDALKVYSQASHSFDDRFIKIAIGEYVISEMMKQP